MMGIHPLTPGLVASAMIRSDHSIFAPYFPDDPIMALIGDPRKRIPDLARRMVAMHRDAEKGELKDAQIYEEFTGAGFYRPDLEEGYVRALDQFPGALALVLDLIATGG